jgi:Ca2+-binding RTX toxin-like protein
MATYQVEVVNATAAEWYMVDEIQEERAANGSLQPLGWSNVVANAADAHTNDAISTGTFVHSDPSADVSAAGWQWRAGQYGWFQNHGWGTHDPGATEQQIAEQNDNGFWSSQSHHDALLIPQNEVIGISLNTNANFQGIQNTHFATEDFGWNERGPILVGAVQKNAVALGGDGDFDYDVGEGLAGVPVVITDTGTGDIYQTTTGTSGGYSVELTSGHIYSVKVGYNDPVSVTMTDDNRELNFFDPKLTAPAVNQTITGTQGANNLVGGDGNDSISGIGGNDTITGGAGDDQLSGGAGADNFVFYAGFGHDTIVDFTAKGNGHDVITFDDSTGLTNFGEVISHARQVGGSLVIVEPGSGDVLELPHTKLSDLSAGDFLFV